MEINIYEKLFDRRNISLKRMLVVVFAFIGLIALIMIFNNNFYDYYNGKAIFENSNKINTLVYIDDLEKIVKNKEIMIGGTTFSYKVDSIDSDNFISGNNIFKMVHLSLESDKSISIENNYVSYYIVLGHDNIVNYFLKKLKGG